MIAQVCQSLQTQILRGKILPGELVIAETFNEKVIMWKLQMSTH